MYKSGYREIALCMYNQRYWGVLRVVIKSCPSIILSFYIYNKESFNVLDLTEYSSLTPLTQFSTVKSATRVLKSYLFIGFEPNSSVSMC